MKTETILISNLMCKGCANTITKTLLKNPEIKEVEVLFDPKSVKVTCTDNVQREEIVSKLLAIGYPEDTDENNLLLKLKSKKSCLIGRISH